MTYKASFSDNNYLLNSSLEVSLRTLVLLNCSNNDTFDIDRLVIFDYFILHGKDIDDTQISIHPPLPHRSSEIIIRRKLIKEGLEILFSRGLVNQTHNKDGIYYSANKNTELFINLLQSEYYRKLTEVINWSLFKYSNVETSILNNIVNENIDIWGGEFEYEALVRSNYDR